jgi:uncharacterized peroxidase-related enzyme
MTLRRTPGKQEKEIVMATRITPVNPAEAQPKAKELLAAVQAKLGMTPNMMRTMAQSPAVLEGYLSLNGALAGGVLPAKVREELALFVGQSNECDYCVAAHSLLGKMAGLQANQLMEARRGVAASDPIGQAALQLARRMLNTRGEVSDADLSAARSAGLNDAQIAEVIAHVALNIFTNYFNRVAHTEVDFPKVPLAL